VPGKEGLPVVGIAGQHGERLESRSLPVGVRSPAQAMQDANVGNTVNAAPKLVE